MKRWCVCPWVNDPEDPTIMIPKVALYTNDFAIIGGIENEFVLAKISVLSLGPLQSDKDIVLAPDITRDAQVNTVAPGIWNSFKTRAKNTGFDFSGINSSTGFGDAITLLGRRLVPDFVDTNVDVSEQ